MGMSNGKLTISNGQFITQANTTKGEGGGP